ncbi:MAG TPA: hypothetical protein VH877_09395 [Polyangia bacterium]|jgi:hypothetical protein|nr:hypothetical protein [Polyangia bacterium]
MATPSSKRRRRRSSRAEAAPNDDERGPEGRREALTVNDEEDFNDPFDPGDAIELLWYQLTRVEALAHAASETLESLPCGDDPESRRAAERIYILVAATAESAEAALDVADAQLARLNESLMAQARNKRP